MEQLTFCVVLLSFWSILSGVYFYCQRGNNDNDTSEIINEADDNNMQQSSSSQRMDSEVIEAVILDEALAAIRDAAVKEQLKMDKLRKKISEALLTKCIVMNEDHDIGIIGDNCNDNGDELKNESIGDDNPNASIEDNAMVDVEKGELQATVCPCNHCSKDIENSDNANSNYNNDDVNNTTILLSDMIQSHGLECNICLSPFQIGDTIAWSKRNYRGNNNKVCKHAFHEECISRWLLVNDECPMCRHSFCS
mmetsp:Transcript_23115/g.43741  ORF Transcript_23115/g.43741 Transcript_23115/m.43741 type:complete len:251 (+) Transcript_23115:607-1359(+)